LKSRYVPRRPVTTVPTESATMVELCIVIRRMGREARRTRQTRGEWGILFVLTGGGCGGGGDGGECSGGQRLGTID
jgi:hypothetical protein